ncbi:PREDICTED: uncharacterized protein LOC104601104 [Nelumbo nucifera]|uniref:Uncharacterized protein LOC104601104 n=2 Tax=Nelumbo nucifera TaxID=4432 RepID=A0A1U8A7P4_NELNU|nr:PREDICTED: uncharacterized protein LOC104601104 [Nelumbo nucifera]DAD28289.1 TPA_asm: hypothetical protein HUJ06_029757 [Nelumbo nucifera]
METDPPSSENLDQVSGTSSDEQGQSHQARSYGCTFCKRGFSNAQALGGHMNIHRKDRAKLKQPSSSSSSQLSLDISQKNPSHPAAVSTEYELPELESRDDRKSSLNWACVVGSREDVEREEIRVGELRQLSLFVEMPSGSSGDRRSGSCGAGHEERRMQSTYCSAEEGLDLELRLGPEPQDTSTPGTREFF